MNSFRSKSFAIISARRHGRFSLSILFCAVFWVAPADFGSGHPYNKLPISHDSYAVSRMTCSHACKVPLWVTRIARILFRLVWTFNVPFSTRQIRGTGQKEANPQLSATPIVQITSFSLFPFPLCHTTSFCQLPEINQGPFPVCGWPAFSQDAQLEGHRQQRLGGDSLSGSLCRASWTLVPLEARNCMNFSTKAQLERKHILLVSS